MPIREEGCDCDNANYSYNDESGDYYEAGAVGLLDDVDLGWLNLLLNLHWFFDGLHCWLPVEVLFGSCS